MVNLDPDADSGSGFRDPDSDPDSYLGFSIPNEKKLFSLMKDFQAQVTTIRLSLKGPCSFQLDISEFFPVLDAFLTVLNPNMDLDPGEPLKYVSPWI